MSISLRIDVKVGESVLIDGGRIRMTLEDKSGRLARLHFTADSQVDIRRSRSLEHIAKVGLGKPNTGAYNPPQQPPT
jgi:hypothetical protein